jgi:hypothetical protein
MRRLQAAAGSGVLVRELAPAGPPQAAATASGSRPAAAVDVELAASLWGDAGAVLVSAVLPSMGLHGVQPYACIAVIQPARNPSESPPRPRRQLQSFPSRPPPQPGSCIAASARGRPSGQRYPAPAGRDAACAWQQQQPLPCCCSLCGLGRRQPAPRFSHQPACQETRSSNSSSSSSGRRKLRRRGSGWRGSGWRRQPCSARWSRRGSRCLAPCLSSLQPLASSSHSSEQ